MTPQEFAALQSQTSSLYDAYAKSPDYGNNQSASYKAYMAARQKQYDANEALSQQQGLADANAGKYDAFQNYTGRPQGELQQRLEQSVASQGPNPGNGWTPSTPTQQQRPMQVAGGGPTVGGATSQQQLPMQMQGGNLGFGGGGMGGYGYEKSPYMDAMATNIMRQVNDNWSRNLAPSIRSGAMQAGGFGGSRQGVVEANALKDINSGLSGALSNLYNTDYQQSMGRNLQRYQGDQSYDLGLRNNDLGFGNLDFNINQGNVNNQLAGANLGMNTWNAQQGANQGAITAGTNMQNTPYNNWSNFNTAANNVGQGLSSNTTNQDMQGNPLMGALGGWNLGTKVAGSLGFGPPVTDGGYSIGQGSAYGGNRAGL
jgi:hypothetical protein